MLTNEQKQEFMREGYVILPGAVAPRHLKAAIHAVNSEELSGGGVDHPGVGDLLHKADLIPALEDLLGEGNVQYGKECQVSISPKDEEAIGEGIGPNDDHRKKGYHTEDGRGPKYTKTGTPFSIMVGVCLSPGQHVDENRGQFTVWPGSHKILHPVIKERWEKGLLDGKTVYGGPGNKVDAGSPKRLLLSPGDVFIAHQRLGHVNGKNVSDMTRKNLYFRVRHKNFEEMLEKIITAPTPYYAFEGLHEMVRAKAGSDGNQGGGHAMHAVMHAAGKQHGGHGGAGGNHRDGPGKHGGGKGHDGPGGKGGHDGPGGKGGHDGPGGKGGHDGPGHGPGGRRHDGAGHGPGGKHQDGPGGRGAGGHNNDGPGHGPGGRRGGRHH